MATQVDLWFEHAQRWPDELRRVRRILLDCGLDEAIKWRKPCYAAQGDNIAILQPMKPHLALMFFKGALLDNAHGALEPQGENSRSAMRICFDSVERVDALEEIVRACVREAIEVERKGLVLERPAQLELCDEMRARLDGDEELRRAFDALTPGRRREYHLHVSGAKRAPTRVSRFEACVPRILEGRGLRDR